MLWQDYVLTAGSIVFSIALIPAIVAREKPPLSTSVPTFFFLYLFSFVYATLSLYISTATTALTGTMWLILAIQRYRRKGINSEQIEKKKEFLARIQTLAAEKGSITNDQVERELGVSNATAERYLNELDKAGVLEQVGATGRAVAYRLR